jgi:hypothetical protein
VDVITPTQRRTIDAIVSIFETGKLPSPAAYGTASILADGAGISYGVHQVTAASLLPALLAEYDRRDGLYAGRLRPYLAQLGATRELRPPGPYPEWVELVLELLRAAGSDPIMQQVQRDLFARGYWEPATAYATSIGLELPLSHLAVYDTWIQSGGGRVARLRDRFPASPPSKGGDEQRWTAQFLGARRKWLAEFSSHDGAKQRLVRSTVYRVDALLELVEADAWDLRLPLVVRGVRIS